MSGDNGESLEALQGPPLDDTLGDIERLVGELMTEPEEFYLSGVVIDLDPENDLFTQSLYEPRLVLDSNEDITTLRLPSPVDPIESVFEVELDETEDQITITGLWHPTGPLISLLREVANAFPEAQTELGSRFTEVVDAAETYQRLQEVIPQDSEEAVSSNEDYSILSIEDAALKERFSAALSAIIADTTSDREVLSTTEKRQEIPRENSELILTTYEGKTNGIAIVHNDFVTRKRIKFVRMTDEPDPEFTISVYTLSALEIAQRRFERNEIDREELASVIMSAYEEGRSASEGAVEDEDTETADPTEQKARLVLSVMKKFRPGDSSEDQSFTDIE